MASVSGTSIETYPSARCRSARPSRCLFEPSGDLLTMGRTGLARWPVHEGPGDSNSLRVGPPDLLSTTQGERIGQSRDGRFLGLMSRLCEPDRRGPRPPEVADPPGTSGRCPLHRDQPRRPLGGDRQPQQQGRSQSLVTSRTAGSRNSFRILGCTPAPIQSRRALAGDESGQRTHACGQSANGGRAPASKGGALAFSPDGRLLAIAQPAGSVQLVEAETGRLVASLDDPQQSRSRQATFTADGSRLILASEDGRAAHVWDLRAIRRELVAMGLDWDWPPLPEPDVTTPAAGPLRVATDLGGHDFSWGGSDPQELDRLNEALEIDPGDFYAIAPSRPGSLRQGPLRPSHRRLHASPRDPAGRSQNPRSAR